MDNRHLLNKTGLAEIKLGHYILELFKYKTNFNY